MVGPQKSSESATPQVRGLEAQAAALMAQALLSRATSLARLGRYDSAELVLSSLPRTLPDALDLLARIRAQQGRMPDAAGLWTEALRIDPTNARYRNGLAKAEKGTWSRWSRPLVTACVALGAFLVIGIAVTRMIYQTPKSAISPAPDRPPTVAVAEERVDVSLPGVIQTRSGATTLLRFQLGLFSNGILITPAARQSLEAIGRQIEPHWRQVTLTIVGHTDDLPLIPRQRFPDNEALAIARADTVIRYLSSVTTIPPSAWAIRLAERAECLYSCDSDAGRLRNRTVDLLIGPLRDLQ